MSIEDLCRGDLVFVNARTSAVGSLGGEAGSWAADAGAGVECRVDSMSASEVAKWAAKGMSVSHEVFFSSEQSLSGKYRLHWTKTDNLETTLSSRYLYVEGYYHENNPEADLRLWIAVCRFEDTRGNT